MDDLLQRVRRCEALQQPEWGDPSRLRDVQAYLAFLESHPELHGTIRDMAAAYRVEDINQAMADAAAGVHVKTILTR